MQICKRNKGITLVALIITIIILLILAGVSLSFVFNGGILDKSQEAVNEYQNAANNESDVLEYINETLDKKLNEIGGGQTDPETPSVDSNGLATENTTIVAKDDKNVQIVIPKGFAPAILQTGTTQSLPGENGAVKEIMPAEKWNDITKEDINRGIVVVDNAITYDNGQPSGTVPDFNEYVWIPIVDSSKFARVAWTTPVGYNENGNWGKWNSKHNLAEVSSLNRFWEEKTTSEYTEMVNSVNSNKGFYITRYEASNNGNSIAQSKRNQKPWVNVSQKTAITASSNMKTSINSHLIYGIEWDSILQLLLDSDSKISSSVKGETKIIELSDIQNYSGSWGNFYDSVGDAAVNSGGSEEKLTGTSEYWKVNNIYDLAGNVYEMTQEKYSTGTIRVCRGGFYINNGDSGPAAVRRNNDEATTNIGRRI